MNDQQSRINSRQYWEERFSGDWDEVGGPEQTRFFAQLALRMLPSWLSASLASCESLVDVGCAEGEAVEHLAKEFPKLSVTGIDFSEQAIATARKRHPDLRFMVGDIARIEEKFDIVFCSNVLEHFHDPLTMLESLVAASRRYVVVMVPGWEMDRHHEHHVTFGLDSFPYTVGDKQCVHVGAMNCARIAADQWPGYQLMVVYASAAALADNKLTLAEVIRSAQMPKLGVSDLVELRLIEPALERLGQLASASLHPPGDATLFLERLAQMESRQEQIGFNTRYEVSELVARLEKSIDAAPLDRIVALGGELEKVRGNAEISRHQLQAELDQANAEAAAAEAAAVELEKVRDNAEISRRELQAELDQANARAAAAEAAAVELEKAKDNAENSCRELEVQLDQANARAAAALAAEQKHQEDLVALEEHCSLRMQEKLQPLQARMLEVQSEAEEAGAASATYKAAVSNLQDAMEEWKQYATALDDDRHRLAKDAGQLVRLLQETHGSTSWKLTSPVRWASSSLLGRGNPPDIPSPEDYAVQELSPPTGGDISWEEFHRRVLAQRDQYRGVFIQEVAIDWNVPLYQRPQHMATAFARIGYLVIYVSYNWGGDNVDGFRELAENIWLTNSWDVNNIPGAIRSVYSTAYAHTPERLSERPDDSIFVYEYIDHIDPQISGAGDTVAKLLRLKQWAFEGGADLIVASARVLQVEAETESTQGAAKVVSVPNGVDTRHYRHSKHGRYSLDPALVEFCNRGPVVGYFGAIAPWLWYDALGELIAARPDLQFVFIGPDYHGGVERLPTGDNVLYLGPIDYQVLPAYGRMFDVCLIPFEPGEIARTTSPLKLFEYFALEKPVVVTSEMVECVAYPEVFRGTDAPGLSKAIDAALAVKDSPEFRHRLRELADENDWDHRAEALAQAVESLSW